MPLRILFQQFHCKGIKVLQSKKIPARGQGRLTVHRWKMVKRMAVLVSAHM